MLIQKLLILLGLVLSALVPYLLAQLLKMMRKSLCDFLSSSQYGLMDQLRQYLTLYPTTMRQVQILVSYLMEQIFDLVGWLEKWVQMMGQVSEQLFCQKMSGSMLQDGYYQNRMWLRKITQNWFRWKNLQICSRNLQGYPRAYVSLCRVQLALYVMPSYKYLCLRVQQVTCSIIILISLTINMNLTKSTTLQKSISMKRVAILKHLIQQAAQQSNTDLVVLTKPNHPTPLQYQIKHNPKKRIFFEKENITSAYNSQLHYDQQKPRYNYNRDEEILLKEDNHRSASAITSFQIKSKILNSSSSAKTVKINQSKKKRGLSTVMELTIDRFQKGKKIGKGRFGSVYIAQDKLTKFILAIKVINKKQLQQSNMESQLLSQIKLQTFMKHPNILKMYGCFHDQINIYLLIELAEECLFSLLTKNEGLQEKQVAYYGKQVCEALKYMHSQSIIHRDIKPQNILLVQGVAKLADFGWSAYSPLYKRQTFCGTLDYVCPEIIEGNYYDEKSDIWSLGVLIYELSTGNAPFESDEGEDATFKRILDGDVHFYKSLSPDLQQLIKDILVKNPKKRLTLKQIDSNEWLKGYANEGRYISAEIWQFWNNS